MSDITQLSEDDRTFLDPYLPQNACNKMEAETACFGQQQSPPHTHRITADRNDDLPFVTLTYASSLDSMIALASGTRTALSGPETKSMTHYLRLCHDAILIGAGTAATDDPGLNCRYPHATLKDQPRPIIVDPNGRWKVETDKKAYRLASESQGKAPWIVITRAPDDTSSADPLFQIGGKYLIAGDPGSSDTAISWVSILRALKQHGIDSVMIEGGATVINALLSCPDLVDSIIITIAPTFLGQGGVAVSPAPKTQDNQRINSAWLDKTSWRQFGNDVVLCGKLRP